MFPLETIVAGKPTLAFRIGDRHLPVAAAGARIGVPLPDVGLYELLQQWDERSVQLSKIAERAGDVSDLLVDAATVVPWFDRVGNVLCAGANYWKHLAEMNVQFEKVPGRSPFYFVKPRGALVGPGRTLPLDPTIQMLDWEVELTAIIGRKGRAIPVEHALEHVAGYTVSVDVTARDRLFQPESIFKFDFFAGKGQDGYCPTAPGMIPASLLRNPQETRISLSVNGVTKQDASTADMIYSVAELVSWVSRNVTLEPGDLLLTGSPEGVGFPRKEFMKAGDVMRVGLQGLPSFDVEVYSR